MALATATITFDVADLLGIDFDTRRIKAWTTTNADNNRLIDTAANKVRMGDGVATVAADGTGSFSVWVPGADGNPTSWQQSFWFDYPLPGGRGREKRSFGPYTITGSADLADLEAEQAIPPTYLSEVAGALSGYVDDAQDARDDAVAAAASADASAATAASAAATAAADAADAVSDELEAAVAYDVALAEAAAAEAQAAADLATDISGIDTTDEAVAVVLAAGAATRAADNKASLTKDGSGFLRLMSEATTRRVKVLTCGTSIASGANSLNALFVSTLAGIYGDAAVFGQNMGGLGGSNQAPFAGWKKQQFAGRFFTRLRASSTSSDLSLDVINSDDRFGFEYSKDTNGGSIEVYDNDVLLGTVSCNGAQSSGNRAEWDIAPGKHTFRLHPVVTGSTYAYAEWLGTWKKNATGIEVMPFQFGGSSLMQIRPGVTQGNADPAQMADPETIDGYAGIDAFFARPDVDAIICSYTVNDAGAIGPTTFETEWKPLVDRAVAKTRASNTHLIWYIEMAGHYAEPRDNKYVEFGLIRDYLLQIGRENNHVTVFDWDGLTRLDNDLVTYYSRYYIFSTYNPTTGVIIGDAIHPDASALITGSAGMHTMHGLPAPANPTSESAIAVVRGQLGDPVLDQSAAAVTSGGVTRRFARGTQLALAAGEINTPVAFYVTDDVAQTEASAAYQAALAASSTSDKYGKYIRYSSDMNVGGQYLSAGQEMWCLMKFKGSLTVSANAGEMFTGTGAGPVPHEVGQRPGFQMFSPDVPTWIAWKQAPTGAGSQVTPYFGGANYFYPDVYEFCAVVADKPVFTRRSPLALAGIGPSTVMQGDAALSVLAIGQSYREDLTTDGVGAGSVVKRLIGAAYRPVTTSGGGAGELLAGRVRPVGLFSTIDSSNVLTSKIGGTDSGVGSYTEGGVATQVGGSGFQAAFSGAHFYQYALTLAASGVDRRTLCMRTSTNPTDLQFDIRVVGNGTLWWDPYSNAWVTSQFVLDPTGLLKGQVLSLPMALPLSGTVSSNSNPIGTSVSLYARFLIGSPSTAVYSDATLAKGSSALILA